MPKMYLRGTCPVCGQVKFIFNPAHPLPGTEYARRESERRKKHPVTFIKCYHKGTPHHNPVFAASSGTKVPMHLHWEVESGIGDRVYPTAGDK
jgi:hypothetical protein